MKSNRSPWVSRTLPRLFRCSTISCCRSVAISASSRAFDLKGETKMARTNQRSPITRSAYAIRPPPQRAEVFGTHRAVPPWGVPDLGICILPEWQESAADQVGGNARRFTKPEKRLVRQELWGISVQRAASI